MLTPVVVEFPLRGEWTAPNTPGKRIPSHGTHILGETYAYDFVRLGPGAQGMRFYRPGLLRYLLFGVRLRECFGWDQPIFAATTGVVVQAEDGWPERDPVHPMRDLAMAFRNARALNGGQAIPYRELAGNYIIVESNAGYAVYVHARCGSIRVSRGDEVSAGQPLASVGHSGNSTAPHLHFQLMDHADPFQARGLPCCFREYEVLRDGSWQLVQNGIPNATERIRRL